VSTSQAMRAIAIRKKVISLIAGKNLTLLVY